MDYGPVPSWLPLVRQLFNRGVKDPVQLVYLLALVELEVAGGERLHARLPRAIATVADVLGGQEEELRRSVALQVIDEVGATGVIASVSRMLPVLGSLAGVLRVRPFNPPPPKHLVSMMREFARSAGIDVPPVATSAPTSPEAPQPTEANLEPPWLVFPEEPSSLRWRMGPGEDYMDRWLPFWSSLSAERRAQYLDDHPPPPAWRAWLERIAQLQPLPSPQGQKYRS